jgi:adenylate cyclase
MLNVVLQELCQVINAEIGFTMLYDKSGQQLDLRAATRTDLFQVSSNYELIVRLANESLQKTTLICYNAPDESLQSLMCLPLILNAEIIGVLGVINHREAGGFNSEDKKLLMAIGSQIDTAIFENIERRRLRQVLGRSVDPRVMERLLANPDVDFLKGERAVISVLYTDLRGSTHLAEHTDPEMLVGFINHYLGQMTDVILAHEGTLDKFVGDEVMALFGAPFPQEDHALKAVRVGLDMQKAHQTVMEIWQDRGIQPAPIGVGIATGELIVGEMGCSRRADYTVIGRAANLGARICGAAQAGEVLISQETYDLIKEHIEVVPITGLQFKGVQRDVTVYRVVRLLE